jgi:hypothetical protein
MQITPADGTRDGEFSHPRGRATSLFERRQPRAGTTFWSIAPKMLCPALRQRVGLRKRVDGEDCNQ